MEIKDDYLQIEEEVRKRGIGQLIHFTPTINLMSIIDQQGLLSRATLEALDIDKYDVLDYAKFTDEIRYDDKNYINLSITGPNTYLFRKFRERTEDEPYIVWCVLKINLEPLYWKETKFSITNAASQAAKKQGIGGDYVSFSKLFSSELFIKNRILRSNHIPQNMPTDSQAEVLVRDKIPLSCIKQVCFVDDESLAMTLAAFSSLKFDSTIFTVDKSLFV